MGFLDWLLGRKKKVQEPEPVISVPKPTKQVEHIKKAEQVGVPDDYAERVRKFKEYEAQEIKRRENEYQKSIATSGRQIRYPNPRVSSYVVGQDTKVVGETTTYIAGTVREFHAPPIPDKNRRCCDNCKYYQASTFIANVGICNNSECYKHGNTVAGSNLNCETDENSFTYRIEV